ncbi:hypothetical protein F4819DRAFT_460457 [Hypoxylon fuscum]|nr:hypothetical protein F4819DRAFT_460457 [Hypoxylon fuscum]
MIDIQIGAVAMVCGWLGFSLICITSLGLLMLILSIRMLCLLNYNFERSAGPDSNRSF